MEQTIQVSVDIQGEPIKVGRLWTRTRHGRESASFEYDQAWLSRPDRFSIDPTLSLGRGVFHTLTHQSLFGALTDCAPDRWGRVLMRRAERRRAEAQGQTPKSLSEIDFLLGVNDETRQGALRFARSEDTPFLAANDDAPIPPLIALPRLMMAAWRIGQDAESAEDLKILLAPGASLGGARPKAAVKDTNGELLIAKFPHHEDDIDVVRWEAVALSIAGQAGIEVPKWRLETVDGRPVLLLKRFDRDHDERIPFISAMTLLQASDNEPRSYIEFVDMLKQCGAAPEQDLAELWRRIVFNVLISNTDDHLRNHGFLHPNTRGWRLSPAYDLNPVPTDIKPRILTTFIDLEDGTASLRLALKVAPYFGLTDDDAKSIAHDVGLAVGQWKKEALRLGLNQTQILRMSSAFEHDDLSLALSY